MQQSDEMNFWQFTTDYWLKELNSTSIGLPQKSAAQLLLKYGKPTSGTSGFRKDSILLLRQFKSPLMLLLIGAVILSSFLGDTSDVFIILFIVLSTGLLSFFQERNAGKVVEKLQSLIALKSTVVRDGAPVEIPTARIVPGDVVQFQAGDIIPADCLLLEANELHVNESSLTGESFPIRKETGVLVKDTELAKRKNCLWEGTNIVSGNAKALVIFTGENTIFGNISKSAGKTVETTFEKGIKDFGFFLMKITLVLAVFILIVNLLNHQNVIESALFALAIAVGMAPELLPAISTIAMSAGAKRMLEKKVIVKKLASIQNLGEINLLCTDKTGTITDGKIKVSQITNGFGEPDEQVSQLAFWNAYYETGYSNPIDEALKELKLENAGKAEKKGEVPYDFIRKRLSIALKSTNGNLLVSKGAFSQIVNICTKIKLKDQRVTDITSYKADLEKRYEQYGINGLRAIGICYKEIESETIDKEDESGMTFAGFILLNDQIKAGIKETLSELNQLKVDLKIITGDNQNVARSIALSLGIREPVILTGKELNEISPEALIQLAPKTHIFAEVEPQQKERIILSLKKKYSVAYIGDGINDVSAINAADVGISVENAVDIAREAADFVLMEKNLMVLADGIREGRKTFANTLKYLYISTGSTFGNMCSVAAASLILPFLPMLPKQILLTNFLTDFPFLMVTSDNVDKEQLDQPGKWDLKMIRNYMVVFGIHSSLFDIITFLTLLFVLKVKESGFQTGWFIESVLSEIFILFIIRTHKNFFKSLPGKNLFILSVIALFTTILLPYLPVAGNIGLTPLPMLNLAAMLSIVLAYILTADLLKVWFFKKYRNA